MVRCTDKYSGCVPNTFFAPGVAVFRREFTHFYQKGNKKDNKQMDFIFDSYEKIFEVMVKVSKKQGPRSLKYHEILHQKQLKLAFDIDLPYGSTKYITNDAEFIGKLFEFIDLLVEVYTPFIKLVIPIKSSDFVAFVTRGKKYSARVVCTRIETVDAVTLQKITECTVEWLTEHDPEFMLQTQFGNAIDKNLFQSMRAPYNSKAPIDANPMEYCDPVKKVPSGEFNLDLFKKGLMTFSLSSETYPVNLISLKRMEGPISLSSSGSSNSLLSTGILINGLPEKKKKKSILGDYSKDVVFSVWENEKIKCYRKCLERYYKQMYKRSFSIDFSEIYLRRCVEHPKMDEFTVDNQLPCAIVWRYQVNCNEECKNSKYNQHLVQEPRDHKTFLRTQLTFSVDHAKGVIYARCWNRECQKKAKVVELSCEILDLLLEYKILK